MAHPGARQSAGSSRSALLGPAVPASCLEAGWVVEFLLDPRPVAVAGGGRDSGAVVPRPALALLAARRVRRL